MENNQSFQDEICNNIYEGNFSRALQNSEEWLKSFPPTLLGISSQLQISDNESLDSDSNDLSENNTPEYQMATEAFFYSRFFFHRHDRLASIPLNAEKARLFLEFLEEIEILRTQKKFSLDTPIYYAAIQYIHRQVAKGFSNAFAGQKAYDLNENEILQLARSMIIINNWSAAHETLRFLILSKRSPDILLLLSFSYLYLPENQVPDAEKQFEEHFREALFIKPDTLKDYLEYLPEGKFLHLWEQLKIQNYPEPIIFYYYALLTEVNGFYQKQNIILEPVLEKYEQDFKKIQETYEKNPHREEMLPRLLLLLCRILIHYWQVESNDSKEYYRDLFIMYNEDMWKSFQKKVLKTLPTNSQ